MRSNSTASKLAEYLLQIKAVSFSPEKPYTWASGWKSPIYCDNRLAISDPESRTFIKRKLAKLIKERYPDAEIIIGVATAGISPGVLCADRLALPFAYVRSSPKEHGKGNQIEGLWHKGQKAVVVEDLISTGKSSLKTVEVVRQCGLDVLGLAAIFTYGFEEAEDNFRKAHCPFYTLGDYNTTIKAARDMGYIKKSDMENLKQWRVKPAEWGNEIGK